MTVRLYTRHGCHLCEQSGAWLAELAREYPHRIEAVDIDEDQRLRERYGLTVPVVVIDREFVLAGRIARESLADALARAVNRGPGDRS